MAKILVMTFLSEIFVVVSPGMIENIAIIDPEEKKGWEIKRVLKILFNRPLSSINLLLINRTQSATFKLNQSWIFTITNK